MKFENLSEFMDIQLPVFDSVLADEQVPLQERPLQAADIFVSLCIVNEDDNTDRFWELFAEIYESIKSWYAQRYADAMKNFRQYLVPGVVLIYNTPFELKIPLNTYRPDKPGETMWIGFPNTVLSEENVFEWIVAAPNLESMESQIIVDIKKKITKVVEATRSIRLDLLTATYSNESMRRLAGTIMPHIFKAVRDMLGLREEHVSIAFWEIHLATEKALKVFLHQCGETPPNTHDLVKLCSLAETHGLSIDQNLIKSMLPHHESIGLRYGEGILRTVSEAVSAYNNSLDIITVCTKALHRKAVVNNFRFLIKVPRLM